METSLSGRQTLLNRPPWWESIPQVKSFSSHFFFLMAGVYIPGACRYLADRLSVETIPLPESKIVPFMPRM